MIYDASPVAVGVFLLFVAITLALSFYFGRKTKSAAGYFAAGGEIPWFVNGIAFAGDYLSAASFLGICGMIAFYGYDGFLYSIGYLAGWVVALFVIAEPLKRMGRFTFADALDSRFQSRGIKLSASHRKARRKQVLDKKVFDDMVFRNKLKSFTVAGDLHNSQIQKIMTAANTAIARGVPFRDFKRSLDLETYKRITSPEVVFRNTSQNAYQLGRFNQQEKLKNIRPFGEYVTFGDDRVRPNHAILNGRVAALDDAFWAQNYPPNGHQCRCVRRTFSKRQIDNKGLKVRTFDQINGDAAREQAARGIPPTKQVAPLADTGWQGSFALGDTGAEQFIKNFKNFEPAALKSIVTPKPVQIAPPKVKPIADTTNHVELSLAIEKELGIKNSTFANLSLESSKAFSKTLVGLTKKYDKRDRG